MLGDYAQTEANPSLHSPITGLNLIGPAIHTGSGSRGYWQRSHNPKRMDLRDYLAEAARTLLSESQFLDVLPGFVLVSERVPIIRERLASIVTGTRNDG